MTPTQLQPALLQQELCSAEAAMIFAQRKKLECAVAAAHFVRGQQVDHFVLQQQLVQQQPQRVLRGG